MKTQIRSYLAGGFCAALLWSPMLQAQERTIAEIPFDFHVRNITLPAGSYTVVRTATPYIFAVEHNDGGPAVFLLSDSNDLKGIPDPKMTFHCYDERCFLSRIGMPDGRIYNVSKSKLEKELASGGAKVATAYVSFGRAN